MTQLRERDDGASLILVLIIVTVLSITLGVVLDQSDTALHSTVALRNQTANNYGGDAAAQAIITQIGNGKIACTTLSGAGETTNLGSTSGFYVPTGTNQGPLNATATCLPDTVNGLRSIGSGQVTIDTSNTLGYSVLTTGTNSGQTYRANGAGSKVCISGGSVASNSYINIDVNGPLATGLATSQTVCNVTVPPLPAVYTVTAANSNGCNGQANDSNSGDFQTITCTHAAQVSPTDVGSTKGWENYASLPNAPITRTDPAPLCATDSGGNKYAIFLPGKYTSASISNLNARSGSACNADFEWFPGGTYYFDFGATTWNWPSFLVAGTPQSAVGPAGMPGTVVASLANFDFSTITATNATPAQLGTLAAGLAIVRTNHPFPGACADPALQQAYPGDEFVFGGASRFAPNSSSNNEICATYSDPGLPIAIYGVSPDANNGNNTLTVTGGSINAETLCASPGSGCTYASADAGSGPASTLMVTPSNGHESIYVHGYIYAPSAPIVANVANSFAVLLGWGLVLRSLSIVENGSSPTGPYIAYRPTLHQAATNYYTVRYINVWTCVASSTPCLTSGAPNVQVKIQSTLDSNGNIISNKVLSWSRLN